LFIPAIGIPQSYDCFDSLRFRKLLDNEKIEFSYHKIGYYNAKLQKSQLYDAQKHSFLCVSVD
jgi:hypothetical protein